MGLALGMEGMRELARWERPEKPANRASSLLADSGGDRLLEDPEACWTAGVSRVPELA